MRLSIDGFDVLIPIEAGFVSELSIQNKTLFSRIVGSLRSEKGESATEPYRLYSNDGEKVKAPGAMLFVDSPFCLPWNHKLLSGAFYRVFEDRLFEEDTVRDNIECIAETMNRSLREFGLTFNADLSFEVEWDVKKYLKAFSFSVEMPEDVSLLDSLIQFFAFSSDVGLRQPLVFVGLETFFSKEDLILLFEQAVFFDLGLLLIESRASEIIWHSLRKYTIDQHFLVC